MAPLFKTELQFGNDNIAFGPNNNESINTSARNSSRNSNSNNEVDVMETPNDLSCGHSPTSVAAFPSVPPYLSSANKRRRIVRQGEGGSVKGILKKENIFAAASSSSFQKKKKKKYKKVQFTQLSEQYCIPNSNDLTPEERRNSYLLYRDYLRIRDDNDYTLVAMNRGQFPDSSLETFRGLESSMTGHCQGRKRHIAATISSVLRVQQKFCRGHFNKKTGIHTPPYMRSLDPSWVGSIISKQTALSSQYAWRAAQGDARAAAAIFKVK